jgi:hypothetical protein
MCKFYICAVVGVIIEYGNEIYRNRLRGCGLDSMYPGKKEPCAGSCAQVNHKGKEALTSMSNNTMDVYRNCILTTSGLTGCASGITDFFFTSLDKAFLISKTSSFGLPE